MEARDKLFFKDNSKEEYLPGYSAEFPYVSSYVEMDKYPRRYAPWHWHNTVELFYVKNGVIEYYTPQGKRVFTKGMGGLVNADVLHMTKLRPDVYDNIVLVHLFDASFLAGGKGSLIEQKYIQPLLTDSRIELVELSPEEKEAASILKLLEKSFTLDEQTAGYELFLRNSLSEIWFAILELTEKQKIAALDRKKSNNQMKQMMLYIQEHYAEKITVAQVANAAFLSERAVFRLFRDCLHVTPAEYMRNYRLQMACRMLEGNEHAIGEIGEACGLGSNSYFGKIFKEEIGCTPLEYRYKKSRQILP